MLVVMPADPRWIAVGQVSDPPYVDPPAAQPLFSGAVREKVRLPCLVGSPCCDPFSFHTER